MHKLHAQFKNATKDGDPSLKVSPINAQVQEQWRLALGLMEHLLEHGPQPSIITHRGLLNLFSRSEGFRLREGFQRKLGLGLRDQQFGRGA